MRQAFYLMMLLAVLFSNACTTPTSGDNTAAPASSPAANDQAAAPRQRFWVTETHVKPELIAQFREFYLKETLPAQQKAGVKQQSVWTTAMLGEAFEYVTIRPIEGLQQFDENPMVKVLGEEGARQWAAKRATLIVRSHSYVMQARPDMSIAPNQDYIPKLAFVTRASIAPGRSADHENYIKTDVLPIIKKTNVKGQLVNKVAQGGDTEMYITATFMDSFADYDNWAAALQKEGYGNVVAKRAGIMLHREAAVYRYVPELSIRPQTVAANK
ncbi:MAG TPA: hypothetical protein VFZ34_07110 [Blastocatellia bacterium]|nr:hypothetical protein [Blastocatellia bacterium]